MNHGFLKNGVAAALGLLAVSAAAPLALADVPGYEFRDFEQHSPVDASSIARRAAADAQIETANEKADRALAAAQQALMAAQQTTRKYMSSASAKE